MAKSDTESVQERTRCLIFGQISTIIGKNEKGWLGGGDTCILSTVHHGSMRPPFFSLCMPQGTGYSGIGHHGVGFFFPPLDKERKSICPAALSV